MKTLKEVAEYLSYLAKEFPDEKVVVNGGYGKKFSITDIMVLHKEDVDEVDFISINIKEKNDY